ncbi:hypothetical protein H6G29_09105 [Aphanizomenon flos-aquae FACHB-1290]|nr:hypothetical protein [Aphanizomenon flos-aquae]MBD2557010.1 hypothetical protein [Aphanizomenon flos-aquae FACHB-1290]
MGEVGANGRSPLQDDRLSVLRFARTGVQEKERRKKKIKQLPITNYQLPITNYQLPITNYQLPITNYQLPITNYQLPITNYQNYEYRRIISTVFRK